MKLNFFPRIKIEFKPTKQKQNTGLGIRKLLQMLYFAVS